jgi:small subunit ribosomal protein S17
MAERGVRKKLTGVVVSKKMEKTAMVLISRIKKHDTYKKYLRRQSKYMVHDPQNRCSVGDRVRIIESRPLSKRKRWQLLEVIARGAQSEAE